MKTSRTPEPKPAHVASAQDGTRVAAPDVDAERLHRWIAVIAVLGVAGMLLWPILETSKPIDKQLASTDELMLKHLVDGSTSLSPLPKYRPEVAEAVSIGKKLFTDTRLTSAGIGCSSCHELHNYGTLRRPLSPLLTGGEDEVNVPSIFNVGLNLSMGWLGRAETLHQQLDHVINDPRHMGSGWDYVVTQVKADPIYREKFKRIYPGGINRESIADAIVRFEMALITPGSPFDRYLLGDQEALSTAQQRGYRKFTELGCVACHQGVNLGGNLYAVYGVFESPFSNRTSSRIDAGRYLFTGREEDRHVFRVPSLRNIAQTGPYGHDGSVASLSQMIRRMGRFQLGQRLSEDDVRDIEAFLHALTAPLPEVLR